MDGGAVIFLNIVRVRAFRSLGATVEFLFSKVCSSRGFLVRRNDAFMGDRVIGLLRETLLPVGGECKRGRSMVVSVSSVYRRGGSVVILCPCNNASFKDFVLFII